MDAQHVFYVIGSIALGIMIVTLLGVIYLGYRLQIFIEFLDKEVNEEINL